MLDRKLLDEWNYEKNSKAPDAFSRGSSVKVWWKCSTCGFEWQACVKNRIKGTGCPACGNKRKAQSTSTHLSLVTDSNLISEWNNEKNSELNPSDLTLGSGKRAWWTCQNGHSWEAIISSRAKGSGCPYCSGRLPILGENDLLTTHPKIAMEYAASKNNIELSSLKGYSHILVWWCCGDCGFFWKARVADRIKGYGCPRCQRSFRTSAPEQIILFYLRKIFPNVINSYKPKWLGGHGREIDIFIPSINLGIEYDGNRWHNNPQRDENKSQVIRSHGINLLRIRELGCPDIDENIDIIKINEIARQDYEYMGAVVKDILNYITRKMHTQSNLPEIDVNINRDLPHIIAAYSATKKSKSLAEIEPNVAREWNYEKNGALRPDMVTYSSNRKVWWLCKECGYEWCGSINNRIKRGCPVCNGKTTLKGYNDLETIYPHIAEEWDYEKNAPLLPSQVTKGYDKPVWFICKQCGYSWRTRVYSRTGGKGCPFCAGKIIISGINDLKTLCPELEAEWDYGKNQDVKIDECGIGSKKKVWWVCKKCGNEWEAVIGNRARLHASCPLCAIKKRTQVIGKKVYCIETHQVYESIARAIKETGISSISACLHGKSKQAGGLHWVYYDEEP